MPTKESTSYNIAPHGDDEGYDEYQQQVINELKLILQTIKLINTNLVNSIQILNTRDNKGNIEYKAIVKETVETINSIVDKLKY